MQRESGETERFAAVSSSSARSSHSVSTVLNVVAGFVFLTGLLLWVWLADWRWAATGVLLTFGLAFVSSLCEEPERLP